MTVGVYFIYNCKNGKKYFGQSINVEKRLTEHIRELRRNKHVNPHLQKSFNKYKEDSFLFSLLQECSINKLDKLEKFYIKKFNTIDKNYGYNKDSGGNNQRVLSEDHKKNISKGRLQLTKEQKSHYRPSKLKENNHRYNKDNETDYVEIRKVHGKAYKQGFRYVYCKNGEGKSRNHLKKSVDLNKVIKWAIENKMLLTRRNNNDNTTK